MLAFFIAHGFPYVYISNLVPFLGGTRTKLNTQWIQPLLHKPKHFSIEMNEFFLSYPFIHLGII